MSAALEPVAAKAAGVWYPSEESSLAVLKSCRHSAIALRAWSRPKNRLSFKSNRASGR